MNDNHDDDHIIGRIRALNDHLEDAFRQNLRDPARTESFLSKLDELTKPSKPVPSGRHRRKWYKGPQFGPVVSALAAAAVVAVALSFVKPSDSAEQTMGAPGTEPVPATLPANQPEGSHLSRTPAAPATLPGMAPALTGPDPANNPSETVDQPVTSLRPHAATAGRPLGLAVEFRFALADGAVVPRCASYSGWGRPPAEGGAVLVILESGSAQEYFGSLISFDDTGNWRAADVVVGAGRDAGEFTLRAYAISPEEAHRLTAQDHAQSVVVKGQRLSEITVHRSSQPGTC
jgi:hypothetical protein